MGRDNNFFIELIDKINSGDEESLNTLFIELKGLVESRARKFFASGADCTDISQEGMIGLLKAVESFNHKRCDFLPYAILCIDRTIISSIKNREKLNIDFCEVIESTSSINPEKEYIEKEKLNLFREFLDSNLSDLEKEIYELYIDGMSYKDIAKELDKSTKSIDSSLQRIKKKSQNWLDNL